MHTLLPHSAPKLLPINIRPEWAQVQSWLGSPPAAAFVADGANPAPTLQRGPSPGATSRQVCMGSSVGSIRGTLRTVQCLASATRANGKIPGPRRPVGTTLEERSIGRHVLPHL